MKNRLIPNQRTYDISGVAGIFFRGERPSHLKAITRPPHGSGRRSPPDGSEVSFFKTIQSIWKWIHFSIIATFSWPKNPIFIRKISKNWTYFTRISEFLRKIILKFHLLWFPINPEKFSVNSEKFVKKVNFP